MTTVRPINSNFWPRVPLIYLHLTSLFARHTASTSARTLSESFPQLHTASCCVYCFKSQKQKTSRKMAERVLSSQLHRLYRRAEQTLPGTVWTPDTLPPESGNRFSSTVDRVCCLARPLQSTLSALDSAPVVFRCAAQTLGLETFFFFCSATLRSSFCWPDFYKLMECVCSGFCCFCSRPFGYLYLQWIRRFLQTFRPKTDVDSFA